MPARAPKRNWSSLGIINTEELVYVDKVLDAAAWTYVAGTLQSVLILLYWLMRVNSRRDSAAARWANCKSACDYFCAARMA